MEIIDWAKRKAAEADAEPDLRTRKKEQIAA
jgi:hypothetical protein